MNRSMKRLAREIRDYFENVSRLPVVSAVSPEEIRRRLAERFDFRRPIALERLIPEVSELLRSFSLHTTHPRYFGLFNPGVRPAALPG